MDRKLTIKNFKCFLEHEIEFGELTVLAGANSVGKSTTIQAILLAKISTEEKSRNTSRVPINGSYNLNLGNTAEIINQKSNEKNITFSFQNFNDVFAGSLYSIEFEDPKGRDAYELIISKMNHSTSEKDYKMLYYLNAERLGPRLGYSVGSLPFTYVGFQGEYTIQVLEKLKDERVNEQKKFNNNENPKLSSQVNLWMSYIAPGVVVDVPKLYEKVRTAEMSYGESSPTNVGFGISYILPIIVTGLLAEKGSMFIVENPEAHLHPSGQSRIGQFLAQVAASGVQVIVETHSEHVINGMRIAAINDVISNEDVIINFFSKKGNNEQPNVDKIGINEMGDLTKFPYGFFDQAIHDTTTIIKKRREKK